MPHVLLDNERSSSIMGHDAKDIYVSISPAGEVVYSRRITATLYCWMDLQKFPFDEQDCDIILTSCKIGIFKGFKNYRSIIF